MQDWLIQLSINHTFLVYALIVFLGFIEGPFISLFMGVFIKLNYLGFIPAYGALMLGDLLGDTVWYYIGLIYGNRFIKRFGKYFNVTEQKIERVKQIFHGYKHPILFFSKITNGFGFSLATLMTAGMVKIPFFRYILINVSGQFIWTGFLISVGYFFGNLYIQVNAIIGKMTIVAVFIVLFAAFYQFRVYLQNKIIKTL